MTDDQIPEWLAELDRAAEAAFSAQRAHRRPGSHLMLTGEQWALRDEFGQLQDRQARRFSALADQVAGRWRGIF